jgi:hypothetical protein
MKYPIIISFFIIALVTGTQVVDELNSGYYHDTGHYLLGYHSGANQQTFNSFSNNLAAYNETNLNGTINSNYLTQTQQPNQGLLVWVDQWIKSLTGIGAIFSVVYHCTFGFGVYINNLFYVPLGNTNLLSNTWVWIIGILNGLLQAISIIGFLRGMTIGD